MGFLKKLTEPSATMRERSRKLDNDPEFQKRVQETMRKMEEDKIKNPMPHCPLCGSTNIRRISSSAKVGNTLAFGIYGNKRKKQFECLNPNCRYKF